MRGKEIANAAADTQETGLHPLAFDRAGYRGFDLFFILSGVLSLAALLFLPVITRARPRPADDPL